MTIGVNPSRRLRATIAFVAAASAGLVAGCGETKETRTPVQTEAVGRRDIVVDAQATGTVEPINVVDIKSRASGQITRMPVDIGTVVTPGDLIVQIDTRDVQNNFDQASAQMKSAEASLAVATSQQRRSEELYKGKVITQAEFETAALTFAQATAQVVNARSQLDLAKQRLEDATIRAPIYGTIISKNVSLGTIITSSLNAVGGGTTLVQMADLSKVRSRALVNETDIGGLRAGQAVTVRIDAYPDRPFQGTVERIEPQAVVQQSVTMFPVLISLRNDEGFLRPGMNGEVSIVTDRREGSLAVPNDAVRSMRELASAAPLVGLTAGSAQAMLQAQGDAQGGAQSPAGGMPRGQQDRRAAAGGGAEASSGDRRGGREMAMGGMRGDSGRRGGREMAMGGMRGDSGRRGGRDGQGGGGQMGGRGNGTGAGQAPRGDEAGRPVQLGLSSGRPGGTKSRSALVFVMDDKGAFSPRMVRLGIANYDYAEVIGGLKEGEKVALLSAAALQMARQQQNDRFKSMSGQGMPGAGGSKAPGGGGGGAPGGGGGGRRPGG